MNTDKNKQPRSVHDIAQDLISHALDIQTACKDQHEVEKSAIAIQRLSRQLLLIPTQTTEAWGAGLVAMVTKIERGDAPPAKELELQLVTLDVAAAKIRNFLCANGRRLSVAVAPPPPPAPPARGGESCGSLRLEAA